MATLAPIPKPPTVPFLGNALLIDKDIPEKSLMLLASQYGEIFQFTFPSGKTMIHACTYNLVSQVSDDKHFKKYLHEVLREVRNFAGDGLFTSYLEEPNWGKAHRILMPAFGTGNVIHMFDDMKDICDQMTKKWERFGPDNVFDPSEDYTRLTFDTIALCSMSHRFNSFYDPNLPKFSQEMADVLIESSNRAFRLPIVKALPALTKSTDEKYFTAIKNMLSIGHSIVAERKAHPTDKKDLLSLMLGGKDSKTGEGLSDENIMNNLLTFLVAGHETTSGMLTFTTFFLLKNPETLQKLREELDRVIGNDEVTLDHLNKLEYLRAVMRESLRLAPPAPTRGVCPKDDTYLVGGDGNINNPENKKYFIKKDQTIIIHPILSMRDPRVWGEDAEEFRPERMLDGNFEKLPFQAWQPFGYGMRACIGRPFAWQEAQLVLASVYSKFDVFLADPGYTLQVKQTITIKPKNLKIRVVPRNRSTTTTITKQIVSKDSEVSGQAHSGLEATSSLKLYVYYGSNTGSCESFAGRIASSAAGHGFEAILSTLDMATARIPTDGPMVIVTASYEGEPADNAAQFVDWLQRLDSQKKVLKSVQFGVFGCGNKEWVHTYQRIPTLCDELLEKNGAERILGRGEADASSSKFFQVFDDYEANLWVELRKRFSISDKVQTDSELDSFSVQLVDAGTNRAKLLRQPDAAMGKVIENRLLSNLGAPEKRHIEILLPEGMAYRSGDYIAILPANPLDTIKRVLVRFGMSSEQEILIKSKGPTTFPVDQPISIQQLLHGYVELGQPATKRDLERLLKYASKEGSQFIRSLQENYERDVIEKRLSILEILEQSPDTSLPFGVYFHMLPPMRIRQYSISSSPLINAQHVTLTVSVINAPALSGLDHRYLGVASNYLATLRPGDLLPVAVRQSNIAFHLPGDPLVPIIMFCAGSGIAPFRGFIQERAAQKDAGREVGKMLLFFGCRSPDQDYLYADSDLAEWTKSGIVDVRPAFSRKAESSEGSKYVQDRAWHDREEILRLFRANAKLFTCGSRKAANGIRKVCIDIIKATKPGITDEDSLAIFEQVQKERYATDVFD